MHRTRTRTHLTADDQGRTPPRAALPIRRATAMLVALPLSVSLAACGSGGSKSATATTTSSSASSSSSSSSQTSTSPTSTRPATVTKTVTAAPGGVATSSTAAGSPSASDDQSLPKAASGCDGNNPQVRPSEIDISCDGTYVIKNLSWSSWTSSSATGVGDIIKVTCTPDCADGPATTKRLPIRLSAPQSSPDGQEFSKIDTDPGGPNADSGSLTIAQ